MLYSKFIVNPVAGAHTTHKKWQLIITLLKRLGLRFDYEFTEGAGHAIELARSAVTGGYGRVVAVGGDGTVNEVANGILSSNNSTGTLLGVISTGTGGDFIKSAGIPHNYVKACSNLTGSRRLFIDVGVVECRKNGQTSKRFFVNTAGLGLDAAVVAATEKLTKHFGGTIPYLWGLARTLFSYKNKSIILSANGRSESQRVVSVIVANGGFAGGGMHFAPSARLDDGLLDMVVVGDFGKIELIRSFPKVYKGTHVFLPRVKVEKVTDITIESSERPLVYADGELLGESPVKFSVMPSALQVTI